MSLWQELHSRNRPQAVAIIVWPQQAYPVLSCKSISSVALFLDQFTYTIKYCETKDIESAIKYANKCATVVVQKKGVATA